ERNRRWLAFRGGGGGLAAAGSSSNNGSGEAAAAWKPQHVNGSKVEEEGELLELELEAARADEEGLAGSGGEAEQEDAGAAEGNGLEEGVAGEEEGSWGAGNGGEEEEGSWGAGNGVEEEGDSIRRWGLGRWSQSRLQKPCVFEGSWLQEFPWLQYCQETGLMSCCWCQKRGSTSGGAGGRDELAKGSRNYKRTLLLRHHLSTEHRMNDPAKQGSEVKPELMNEDYEDYNTRANENSYCYQLLQELNEQRKKGILCDVNIVVNGNVFRAHKNILVAGSCDQTTVTHLDVVAVQGFSVILDFMYSGNLVLTSQNAIEVMSVASYLQMTDVVQSCRDFIKDALNISMKSEAPEAVVVDYNRGRSISRDGLMTSSREQKSSNFWATRNLTSLASSIKTEGYDLMEGHSESYQVSETGWAQNDSSEMAECEAQGPGKVFVWNEIGKQTIKQEPGSARRKNQTARKFVYNFPLKSEDTFEDNLVVQPSASYFDEDWKSLQEYAELDMELASLPPPPRKKKTCLVLSVCSFQTAKHYSSSCQGVWSLLPLFGINFKFAPLEGKLKDFHFKLMKGTSDQFKCGLFQESKPEPIWANGETPDVSVNKLKCPHCNYIAKYRRTLKRHLLIHTGVRSFSCDICGKLFTRREHVKRHSLVHKKEKNYKCMVCKKIFMLAASVGIRHGSRRYGVCVDCADKSQPGGQEGADQIQDMEFPREDDFEVEENEVVEVDEDLPDEGGEQIDQSQWAESGDACVTL
uniref:Zinc finger and BTB domain containing 10 n=1 Tax=Latimeria chalumnae TaxID=7897 RepID=H3AZY2_LATCH